MLRIYGAILLCFLGSFKNASISDIRKLYALALTQEASVEQLEKSTKSQISDPVIQAFYGTALALKARNTNWVSTKYSLAKSAFSHLNASVKKSPNNVEVRFLRFSFEANTPSFLGLNSHVEEDKQYLLKYSASTEPLWSVMKGFFSQCSQLSTAEKKSLIDR